MSEHWIERWAVGRTGWHEPEGNQNLRQHWQATGKRVLVPLCGKTPDLLWLEAQGNEVVGVELAELAVEAFFAENGLAYKRADSSLPGFRCTTRNITLYCGDFLEFEGDSFDAHYDRGALIALTPELRARYGPHVASMLTDDALQLVLTVAYDDSICEGPPFCIREEELLTYWPRLRELARVDDSENAPPKFLEAGLSVLHEVVWVS